LFTYIKNTVGPAAIKAMQQKSFIYIYRKLLFTYIKNTVGPEASKATQQA
jgi:hypothetical protein